MDSGVLAKICGLGRREDVDAADAAGADYLGFVLTAGFSRSVDEGAAGGLSRGVRARTVAVLVDESPADAARKAEAIGAGVLQLHGQESPAVVAEVAAAGEWALWKAVRVAVPDDLARAVEQYGDHVEGFLVEGKRDGVVGGGGVKLTLDPESWRSLVGPDHRLILAGGLTAANVSEAIARLRPDVVDVSSGVEASAGEKDPRRVRAFIQAAHAASAIPPSEAVR